MSYDITRTVLTVKTDLSNVVTPQHLLQELLKTEVGNCDCKEPVQETRASEDERQLFIRLIEEYKLEIETKNQEILDAQRLLELRNNLLLELEQLKNQRARIEQNIAMEMKTLESDHRIRITSINAEGDCGYVAEEAQLVHLRDANNKLRLRLKDLLDYIYRIELYNEQLYQNHAIIAEKQRYEPPTRDSEASRMMERETLIRRLQAKTLEQNEQNRRYDQILRRQQEQAMMNVRMQEEQIRRRNMARLQNFKTMYNVTVSPPEVVSEPMRSFYEGGIQGQERGSYQNGVFFPDNGMYRRGI